MRVNSHQGCNSLTIEFVDLERALADLRAHAGERSEALWAMGDILERVFRAASASAELRRAFAKQGVSLARFGSHMGVSIARIQALRLTSASFLPRERHAELSWEHHQAIARRFRHESAATRRKWLREAAKHGWSLGELRARLRRPVPQAMVASERVERLRRQLAEAEARLASLQDTAQKSAPERV